MKVAVIQFPGSNCERETKIALKRCGITPVDFLWNESREKLATMDGYVIVGGFSYEDRSRAGIIAALDPVLDELQTQSALAKPILGICNGAQILVEAGLVPGLENNKVGMALTQNKRVIGQKVIGIGYYNDWIHIKLAPEYQRNAFTRLIDFKDCLRMPVAHAEGRFVMTDALLEEILAQGLAVFQYCDGEGKVSSEFPVNPNGSVANIAGVTNKMGNVLALMPHPERTIAGDPIFHSMREYMENKKLPSTTPLFYYPRRQEIRKYQLPPHTYQCLVELKITDNAALSVQMRLAELGFKVKVRRLTHWEVACDHPGVIEKVQKSGLLYNENKEQIVPAITMPSAAAYLVKPKEDWAGVRLCQQIKKDNSFQGLNSIVSGQLWHFSIEDAKIAGLNEQILKTNIIHNPYAYDCYQF